jgi:uncharacterized membrane protein YhhN
MLKKHLVFTVSYTLITILVCYSAFLDIPKLGYFGRPLIHISLLVFLFVKTKLRGRFHQRLFTGLVFALTAETLFMLRSYEESYFLFSIIAFLICHLFYISAFYLDFLSAKELDKKGARIAIISSAVFFTSFYFYIRHNLGMMRLPVLAYTVVIAVLTMMASFRNKRVNALSFKLILTGVIFIIIADALMALSHFNGAFHYANVLVALSYMIGQYLIITGGVERKLIHMQTPV